MSRLMLSGHVTKLLSLRFPNSFLPSFFLSGRWNKPRAALCPQPQSLESLSGEVWDWELGSSTWVVEVEGRLSLSVCLSRLSTPPLPFPVSHHPFWEVPLKQWRDSRSYSQRPSMGKVPHFRMGRE